MNANTIPLQEVLPWSPDVPRNILVSDSIETDGAFVLSTMAAHLFSSPPSSSPPIPSAVGPRATNNSQRMQSRRALWLSGNVSTEKQVASTLKKMGCDAGAAYLRNNNNNNTSNQNGLTIRSLAVEISEKLLLGSNGDSGNDPFDGETYLKSVYKDIKSWVNPQNEDDESVEVGGPSWVILDDVTSLASMVGDTLVYCFVESLIHLMSRKQTCGLILRCSGDVDQMLHKLQDTEGKDHTGWVGAGGLAHKQSVNDQLCRTLVPWERALEESVDAIVDVLPLLSGFSREAHGRLIFSETPNGRGWKSTPKSSTNAATSRSLPTKPKTTNKSTTTWNKLIFNYSIQDSGARAIRLRA